VSEPQDLVSYYEQNLPNLVADLQKQTVTGVGKLAKVAMSADFDVLSVELDPAAVNEKMKADLEQSVIQAVNDAKKQALAAAATRLAPPAP
jgi:DNA-binding protein YbaB